MMAAPVCHHKALIAELTLKYSIEGVGIRARIAVVNLIVACHYGTSPRSDGVRKWPEIDLMHRPIFQTGTDASSEIITILCDFDRVPESLLLVGNEMTNSRNHSSILNTLDCGCDHFAAVVWVGPEAFGISPCFRESSQSTAYGLQDDISSQHTELVAHIVAIGVHELPIPGRPFSKARWKSRREAHMRDIQSYTLHTYGSKVQSRYRTCLTETSSAEVAPSSCQVDLLEQSEIAHEI